MPLLESVLTDSTSCLRFGYCLGLKMDDLHKIESTYGHDINRCIKQVLFHWRYISPQSSYKKISEALEASGYPVALAMVTQRCSMNKQESEEGSTGLYDIICNGIFLFYVTIIINSYMSTCLIIIFSLLIDSELFNIFSEFDVLCQSLTSFPNGNLMCMRCKLRVPYICISPLWYI